MADPSCSNDLVGQYEALRSQVLGTSTGTSSLSGWVVLVGRGVAAWMASLHTLRALRPASSSTTGVLPELHSQMANILLNMIASHYP